MPVDEELQALYAEANRRGMFKSDADLQALGHELRRRGIVKDTTQGGLVAPVRRTDRAAFRPPSQQQIETYRQQYFGGGQSRNAPAQLRAEVFGAIDQGADAKTIAGMIPPKWSPVGRAAILADASEYARVKGQSAFGSPESMASTGMSPSGGGGVPINLPLTNPYQAQIDALQKRQGVVPSLKRFAYGMGSRENIGMMPLGGLIGKGGGRLLAGAFAAQNAPSAINRIRSGDVSGGATDIALSLSPFALEKMLAPRGERVGPQPALSPEVANQVPLTTEQIARQRFDRMVEAANAEAGIEQPAAASRVLPRRGKPTVAEEVPGAPIQGGGKPQAGEEAIRPGAGGQARTGRSGGQGARGKGAGGRTQEPARTGQAKAAKPAEEVQPPVQQRPQEVASPTEVSGAGQPQTGAAVTPSAPETRAPVAPIEPSVSPTDTVPAPKRNATISVKGQGGAYRDYTYLGKNLEGQHIARSPRDGKIYPLTDEQIADSTRHAAATPAEPASATPKKETPNATPIPATAVEPAAAGSEPTVPTGKAGQVPAGKAAEQPAPVVPRKAKPTPARARKAQADFESTLPGKIVSSYAGGEDQVLKVEKTPSGATQYTVRDTATGQVRRHQTIITPKKVIREAPLPPEYRPATVAPTPKTATPGKAVPIDIPSAVAGMDDLGGYSISTAARQAEVRNVAEKILADPKAPITSAHTGLLKSIPAADQMKFAKAIAAEVKRQSAPTPTATPVRGGKMGKQTGAFDVSILADAAKGIRTAVAKVANLAEDVGRIGDLSRQISSTDVKPVHGYEVMSHGHIRNMSNSIANAMFRGLSHTEEHVPGAQGQIPAVENANRSARENFQRHYLEPAFKGMSAEDRQRFTSYGLVDRLMFDSKNVYPKVEAQLKAEIAKTNPKTAFRKLAALNKQLAGLQQSATDVAARIADWKDPVTSNPVSETDVKAFMDAHRENIAKFKQAELLSNSYRARAGRGTDLHPGGEYGGYYIPGEAENKGGVPAGGGGATKPLFQVGRLTGTKRFLGKADAYNLDPVEVMGAKYANNYRSAFEREFWQSVVKNGAAVDEAKSAGVVADQQYKNYEGKTVTRKVMNIPNRAQPVPAVSVSLADVFHRSSAELKSMGIPERVYLPKKIASEIKPAFDRMYEDEFHPLNPIGWFNKLFISGAAEAVPHGVTIGSARAAVLPKTTGVGPIDALIEGAKGTGVKALMHSVQALAFEPFKKYSTDTRFGAQDIASRYGVARPYQQTGLNPVKIGGQLLYGERGAFNNSLNEIYDFGKKNGWTDDAIGKAMQELNTHSRALRSKSQNWAQSAGMGAFAQTGATSLRRGGKFGAVPLYAGGYVVGMSLLGRSLDPDGKWWWQIPGRKLGQVQVGKAKDGKPVIVDLALDRNMRTLRQIPNAIASGITKGEKPITVAFDAAAMALNQLVGPIVNSPNVGAAASFTPYAPYAVTAKDAWAFNLLPNTSYKLPPWTRKGLEARLEAVLPTLRGVPGFVGTEETQKTYTNEPFGKTGNYLAGLMSLRPSKHDPAAEARAAKQMDRGRETSAKNFLRKLEAAGKK